MPCKHNDIVEDLSVVFPSVPKDLQPVFKGSFPPELWPLILRHIRQPTPTPLSRPMRSALTQPHLAVAARVSKFWYSVCEPLLYEHVTTDYFAELAEDTYPSGTRRRFTRTKSLRIEYLPKGQEPTYKQLVKNCACNGISLWEYVGIPAEEAKRVAIGQARQEIEEYTEALTMLNQRRMSRVFPRLETLAVDSIYGREDDVWDRYEKSWPDAEASMPIQRCTTLFSDFLASGNLKHLCTRDSSGPLCVEFTTHAFAGGPGGYPVNYTRTIHFNKFADQLALPLGGKIRWVSDAPPSEDMASLLIALGRCAGHLYRSRSHMNGELTRAGTFSPRDTADVEIYCSTSSYGPSMFDYQLIEYGLNPIANKSGGRQKFIRRALSKKEEKDMVATLEGKIQRLFRSNGGPKDVFRWYEREQTPDCECCGSAKPL